jgi:putative oxidoreductase
MSTASSTLNRTANRTVTQSRIDFALLLLRVAFGAIMLAHGLQKTFVFGFAGITQGFTQTGVPAPAVMGPFISLLEIFAPLAIIFGLLTRLAAFGLVCDMLGAIFLVHLKNGFFSPTGFEFPLSLLVAYVVLMITGAGEYSIDAAIARRRHATSG